MKIKMKLFKLIIFLVIFLNFISSVGAVEVNSGKINNPVIVREQAMLFYKNGDYTQALSYFNSIDQSQMDEETLLIVANCYETLNSSQDAVDLLNKIILKNPKNFSARYNLGLMFSKQNDYERAIKYFEAAIKANKEFVPAYYNLGNCYYQKNDYKMAKNSYEKAIKLDPNNANAYYNIALTFQNLKNNKEADKYMNLYKNLVENKQ